MPQTSLSEILQNGFYRGGTEPAIDSDGRWYDGNWFRAVADRIESLIESADTADHVAVAVIPRNRPTIAAALVSLLINEHPVRMIYAFQSSEGKARDVLSLRPAVIVADEQDWDQHTLAAAREVGAQVISLRTSVNTAECATVIVEANRTTLAQGPVLQAPQGIEMLTSGTTGPPKRIFISTQVLTAMAGESFVSIERGAASQHKPVSLIFPPFGNVAGVYALLPAAASGRPFALLEKFSVAAWCSAIERNRIQVAGIPPAGVRMVLEEDIPPERLASLAHIYSGAAPLEHDIQDAFEEKYGIPILLSYGATEFGGPVANMTPALRREWGPSKRHSVGLPFAGCQLRIVSATTALPAAPDEEGTIEVICPRVGNEWIRTSDLGVIDADGFLFVRGRADKTINRGGFKVSPDLIVDALRQHPSVAAAVAIGIPDVRLGQVPVAVVELKPSAPVPTEAELMTHARSHLYSMLMPTQIRILHELPRNQSFKVDLAALEALFAKSETAPS